MTLKRRSVSALKRLSIPVSYRVIDDTKLYDCRNVYDNRGVTETRHGLLRYNTTSMSGSVVSLSYFKDTSGNRYKLAKVGTVLNKVNASGAATSIKTGLNSSTKHRGITLNNRHIVAIESDGLYSWNGTTFTQLGQNPPTGATATIANGGSLTDTNNYKIGLTFYASTTGFETNVFESNQVTAASPNLKIDITSIPATAANGTIDTVRVYLKNVTSNTAYLYIGQVSLGTTTYSVNAASTSSITPPTKNAAPLAGGGKFITAFGKKLAYAGNSTYKNDVFISEEDLPDAFDDTASQVVLNIPGQGEITGIATGHYDNNFLNPYLVIFKKTSTTIYSELNGRPEQNTIDNFVGCVSHDTIKIRNGNVYFMSENGWYIISNGILIKKEGRPSSLGDGDIDDIFTRPGWAYEVNAQNFVNFFSAYHSTLNHYLTFVSEGSSNTIYKAYVYEERIGGFRVFEFKKPITCAVEGEDDSGYQCLFIGDATGTVFTYSTRNSCHDEDENGNSQSISTFVLFPYVLPGDMDVSYNFRELTIRAMNSANALEVRAWAEFALQSSSTFSYSFPVTGGFVLDVSQLDYGVLTDDRTVVTAIADINKTGETLLIGVYQDIIDANIKLIQTQLSYNRNGNRNL